MRETFSRVTRTIATIGHSDSNAGLSTCFNTDDFEFQTCKSRIEFAVGDHTTT